MRVEQKGWEVKGIPIYSEELGVEKSGVGGELLRDPGACGSGPPSSSLSFGDQGENA